MSTKEAAKVMKRLYDAVENMTDDAEDGAFTDTKNVALHISLDRFREVLPHAKTALDVLGKRFP